MVTWCVLLDQQVDVGQDGGGVVLPQLTRQGLQGSGALCEVKETNPGTEVNTTNTSCLLRKWSGEPSDNPVVTLEEKSHMELLDG